MVEIFEALDQEEIIFHWIPEWRGVRSLPQRNVLHRHTVDRHMVETAVSAAALTREVHRPDLLLFTALFHDIGKGTEEDHSIRGEELIELKPNKHAIGGIQDSTCKFFSQQEISIQTNDILYMFSDGYYDQFGGPRGKKFKYKQLTSAILSMASASLEEQKNLLSDTLETWRGDLEQVDDVCIVGIKI
jgi:hypothetical protein